MRHIFNLFRYPLKTRLHWWRLFLWLWVVSLPRCGALSVLAAGLDIFCLGVKELLFLLSFPPYFCLCEVLMDLYVAQLPFSLLPQMFLTITTITFLFFFHHRDRNCLLAVLSILCIVWLSQLSQNAALSAFTVSLSLSCWRGRSWSHLWYQIFSWREGNVLTDGTTAILSRSGLCVWVCILIRKNGSLGLALHIEEIWGFSLCISRVHKCYVCFTKSNKDAAIKAAPYYRALRQYNTA